MRWSMQSMQEMEGQAWRHNGWCWSTRKETETLYQLLTKEHGGRIKGKGSGKETGQRKSGGRGWERRQGWRLWYYVFLSSFLLSSSLSSPPIHSLALSASASCNIYLDIVQRRRIMVQGCDTLKRERKENIAWLTSSKKHNSNRYIENNQKMQEKISISVYLTSQWYFFFYIKRVPATGKQK